MTSMLTPESSTCDAATTQATSSINLNDRFTQRTGAVQLTGIQALVRMVYDRALADRAAGMKTGSYISGYEGSPIGGYDLELARHKSFMEPLDIVHDPAVNEELGATAVQGSQLASTSGTLRNDMSGVVGYWYGKAPGLDRSADALHHANLAGVPKDSGAVAIVGDDPEAKSSTVPSNSSGLLAELGMPTLVPADSADIVNFGMHAAWLSRHSGLWAALRVSTPVADGTSTVVLEHSMTAPEMPDHDHVPRTNVLGPRLLKLDESLRKQRLDRVIDYCRTFNLNRMTHGGANDKVGIIAAGYQWLRVVEAHREFGEPDGVRIAKFAMTYPLDLEEVAEFSKGLDTIILAEDIGEFFTTTFKDALYSVARDQWGGRADALPKVMTSRDPLKDLPVVYDRVGINFDRPTPPKRSGQVALPLNVAARTPHFCSGCPHNVSTRASDNTLVGAGIGCHAMVMMMDTDRVGSVVGTAQMGGEGGHWIGMNNFVEESHFVQNLGDGTFLHSGTLALRALVASGANTTLKLLYNGTVAMTGGQDPVGEKPLAGLVKMVEAEDVAKIVITTDDVKRTRSQVSRGVSVRPREDLADVQKELAGIDGVTVLIHDQACATENRRARARGLMPEAATKVVINERICEGCGDCGEKSGCLSVQPVDTEFGRKTQIDQTTCNADYSCLSGDCPAFMTVQAADKTTSTITVPDLDAADLPTPDTAEFSGNHIGSWNVRISGIGGTGVSTLAAIIRTAAHVDGLHVHGVDQTGLAQKGGSVLSDIRLSSVPIDEPGHVPEGAADLILSLDGLTTAADKTLEILNEERTTAVFSTTDVPTGTMVTNTKALRTNPVMLSDSLADRVAKSLIMDAADVSEQLFGKSTYQTMILLGAAVQTGALPVSPESLEAAIAANGRSVGPNIQSFRRGRQLAGDASALNAALMALAEEKPTETDAIAANVPTASESAHQRVVKKLASTVDWDAHPDLLEGIALRVDELERWGTYKDGKEYLEALQEVAVHEQRVSPGSVALLSEFSFGLHKLTAYKDEYEVARLATDPSVMADVEAEFGQGARAHIKLHPPILRALGMDKKISFNAEPGSAHFLVLKKLAGMKKLRGTRLDPFRFGEVRELERKLPAVYRSAIISHAATMTTADQLAQLVDLAAKADGVRGYEQRKLDSGKQLIDAITRYRN